MADETPKNNNMNPVSPLSPSQVPVTQVSKIRQLVIETDGNNVRIVKSELSGSLELIAILNILLSEVSGKK